MKIENNPPNKIEYLIPAGLFILGVLVRFILLGSNPVGLNQDEASAGYEAFALLVSGIDRAGNSWPVLFTAWGSGQNVLYSYLSLPMIALFGLNVFSVRLLAALAGCAALPVFYFLAKRLGGFRLGTVALLCLAVNPWHIMASRWALESNLFPFFLLLGLYLLIRGWENPRFYPLAAGTFALSLYSYGTAFFFVPIFALLALPYLIKSGTLSFRTLCISLAIFALIAFPIALCTLINILGLEQISVFGITLPRLTEARQASTTIFRGGNIAADALDNFKKFAELMLYQNDKLPFNAIPGFGTLYLFGFPLSVLGVVISVRQVFRRPFSPSPDIFPLAALFASILSAFLIDVNINRINMIFIPLIYFCAVGTYALMRRLGRLGFAPVAVYLVSFVLFCTVYFTTFRKTLSEPFFEGFGQAVQYAETLEARREYVTNMVEMPYIFILFYNELPPEEFAHSVSFRNPGAPFQWAASFGKYIFGKYPYDPDGIYVIHRSELDEFGGDFEVSYFGNYAVLLPHK